MIEPSRLLSPKLSVAQLVERRTVKLKGFGLMRISLGRWFESGRRDLLVGLDGRVV